MSQRYLPIFHALLLVLLCGALYFPYLGSAPLFDKGEPREAMAVQDIVRRGEWLVPLKRATDVPSKPPLFHWTAAATYQVTGRLDESTLRFPSALYGTLGVLLVYFFARKLFDSEVALLAGAILATTLVYQDQALDARVDMTLCFFVTFSLALFFSLYRGYLRHPVWYYVFFAVTGIGTLAKGPLGILLPGLVAGVFVLTERKWNLLVKFVFHPGIVLMLSLAAGWYAIAVTRGGEGFFDRQILQENLSRFAGGSGHSHPIYYYIPYLFSQGIPWALFLPVALWDSFKKGSPPGDHLLFLKIWVVVMFVFFSISVGKRAVYLLPLYPALAVLMAAWFVNQNVAAKGRFYYYRAVALFAGFTGVMLCVVVVGELLRQDPASLLAPMEGLLKPKDRANWIIVKDGLRSFGWPFTATAMLAALLWFSLARCLWVSRVRAAVPHLVLITLIFSIVARGLVVPKIAEAKSYRPFMMEVNRLVGSEEKLYLYRGAFNSDPVEFYRGETIQRLDPSGVKIVEQIGDGDAYVIMAEKEWLGLRRLNPSLPPPIVTSTGKGPDGDARIVLVRARIA